MIGFLNPWLLLAVAALPALWWLLRTVPPRPRLIAFPPTRMLKDLENRKQTPARTPWWLMLIRMLAAALVIAALAEPVLNPKRAAGGAGDGPLLLVVDNTWAAAGKWVLRTDMIASLIAEADSAGRVIVVAPTAAAQRGGGPRLEAPKNARETAAAIRPEPFGPKRMELLGLLAPLFSNKPAGRIVWLTDGLDHQDGPAFASGLAKLGSAGALTVFAPGAGEEAVGLASQIGAGGKLTATVKRAEGAARDGTVQAWSRRGQPLGEAPFRLAPGATQADVAFDMPLELRNQVARLDVTGVKSAGAVSLLDSRSRWLRIGLVGAVSREQAQPLLAPLYYINRALAPYMELVAPKETETSAAVDAVLSQNASSVMMADVGKLAGGTLEKVGEWVQKGGVLVRFAGPRLEQGGDDLLPVPLRSGGRTLGGALSWSTPQAIAAFDNDSLFSGLTIPSDVQISRQVLADPAQIVPETKVWARLKDGTPLVTAARRGEGWVVLFHVTANSDWSNLPLSGLFVDMLRRVAGLSGGAGADIGGAATAEVTSAEAPATRREAAAADVLSPVETLNGFGELRAPPSTAQAIRASDIATVRPSAEHPPGLYGPAASARAINLIEPKTVLKPLASLPSGATVMAYQAEKARPLKPELLTLALGLLFADIVAVVLLQMGWSWMRGSSGGSGTRQNPAAAAVALAIGLGMVVGSMGPSPHAFGQSSSTTPPAASPPRSGSPSANRAEDDFAVRVTLKTRLAYVLTGDAATDRASLQGLIGLTSVLTQRTAIEPGEPVGVNVAVDELAFFPVLYWPILTTDKALAPAALAKVDTFMKQGGLIIFDTRDYAQAMPSSAGLQGPGAQALQRMIGRLDIPRLEPVPEGHVLTKSFYLLRTFPGRWDGGQMWVEAGTDADKNDPRRARRADGVSTIIITPNDLAAAWATDGRGRALYPVVPGGEAQRELAYRTGVNIVMYALTGNYKADQVHVPALLERLGQ